MNEETITLDNDHGRPEPIVVRYLEGLNTRAMMAFRGEAGDGFATVKINRETPCGEWRVSGYFDAPRGLMLASLKIAALMQTFVDRVRPNLPGPAIRAELGYMIRVGDFVLLHGHLLPVVRVTETKAFIEQSVGFYRKCEADSSRRGYTKAKARSFDVYPVYPAHKNPEFKKS